MTTYYTSDPHFGHQRIIDLCGRPFKSVDHMNAALIENINETCGPDDDLIILGDVVMGSFAENIKLLGQLAPSLYLVAGNHDRVHRAYHANDTARARFEAMYAEYFQVIYPDGIERWTLRDGTVVKLNHFPYEGDSHDEDRYTEMRPVDDGLPLVCGHVHEAWRTRGRQFNVGVDVNDFRPVREDVIADWAVQLP